MALLTGDAFAFPSLFDRGLRGFYTDCADSPV